MVERYIGVEDEAFIFLTGYWRRSVLERLTHWQLGAEAGVHAMTEMMLAEAGRLMMRRLWMPLCTLRRARRDHDVKLAQPANGRAGGDDDSDLDEAGVGGAFGMNGRGET